MAALTADVCGVYQIDVALEAYYIEMGRKDYKNDEGEGKFKQYTDDNGFEDADLKVELQADPSDCLLVEFDRDFPLIDDIHGDDRLKAIQDILKYIAANGKAPSTEKKEKPPPNKVQDEKEQMKSLYRSRVLGVSRSDEVLDTYLYGEEHGLYTQDDAKHEDHHNQNALRHTEERCPLLPISNAKHQSLKDELLNSSVYSIEMKQWDPIYKKATDLCDGIEKLLGQNGDPNTAFARYIPHCNKYYGIPYKQKISRAHLLSVLLCHDVLPAIPRRAPNELYLEFAHWFKLLNETIIFYGNNLSRTETVYMHFKEKTHVNQCTIHCNVPRIFTKNKEQIPGTVLELSGTQSRTMWTAPYFSMAALLGNKSCVFFKAQLQVRSVWCDSNKYDMSPISLYDAILNGDILAIHHDLAGENTVPLTASHPDIPQMLKHCEETQEILYINSAEVTDKIKCENLKTRLKALQNTKTTKEAERFVWKPTDTEMLPFITEETDRIVSENMTSSAGSKLYCQMSIREHSTRRFGLISLTVLRLPSKQNQATISFQFYCQSLNDFYVRFDDVVIKMDGDENNAKQTAFFELDELQNAIERERSIEWTIVVIHKDIKRVSVAAVGAGGNKNTTKDIMTQHEVDAARLCDELSRNSRLQYLPLHRFDELHVHDVIKCWIVNDIQFKKQLRTIINLFSDYSLSGERILSFSMNNIRQILQKDLLAFMTKDTFRILMKKIKHWKTVDDEDIPSKCAEQIGYLLHHYPMTKLLRRVLHKNDKVTGQRFIEYYEQNNDWISKITGWNATDVYQIQSVFFKYASFSSSQIKQKTKIALSEQPACIDIGKCIDSYEDIALETINYKIKNGSNELHAFSDEVIEVVSNIGDGKHMNGVYEAVGECFIANYSQLLSDIPSEYELNKCPSWTCANCSNYNFSNFIDGKINVNLSICSLCGVKQRDIVTMVLKKYDTYTMVNNQMHTAPIATDAEAKTDDIDALIQSAMKDQDLKLHCLRRNDNKSCPSMLRLAKQLIIYKRWLSNKNDNIRSTTQVDIQNYVTNDQFQDLFVECMRSIAKIAKNEDLVRVLTKLLKADAMNKDVFLSLNRKEFGAKVVESINSKKLTGPSLKLYSAINNSLKDKAHAAQFGKLCLDFKSGSIDADYHHILESHIKNGNKITAENASRFFARVVHYEDKSSKTEDCKSVNRMKEAEALDLIKNQHKPKPGEMAEDKDIWSSIQYYTQRQLDMIHSFLIHSNWGYFLKRYVKSDDHQDEEEEIDDDEATSDEKWSTEQMEQNKHKFVSDLQESTAQNNYGFGVDHQHPYLKPQHHCMRDELLFNTLQSIHASMFPRLLTKALNKHQIALHNGEYKEKYGLVCTYYKKEFNLTRNEPIGIRHILAIVIYTDLSKFCTAFRRTYRRLDHETSDEEVIERHEQIYHFARALYEAVEFFGIPMQSKDIVYHGLNRVLFFQKFTAYFSQPMSTTTSSTIAYQFAEGQGVVLMLKSGIGFENVNVSKIPKYLAVSWLSQFPNEEELLYYGDNVLFKLYDIIEMKGNVRHRHDLLALNTFQDIVQNRCVRWRNRSAELARIIGLIDNQKIINKSQDEQDMKQQSYTQRLFGYFCDHPSTTSIGINNYNALPQELKMALFFKQNAKRDDQPPTRVMTIDHLVHLFRHLAAIKFNNLKLKEMLQYGESFVSAVYDHLKHNEDVLLMGVAFESESQQIGKDDTTLHKLMNSNKNQKKFKKIGWNAQYNFDFNSLKHGLTFVNNNKAIQDKIQPSKVEETIDEYVSKSLIQFTVCRWMDNVSYFMQVTSIKMDRISIQIVSRTMNHKMDHRLRLKQVGINLKNATESTPVDTAIIFRKNTTIATTEVQMDGIPPKGFHLALFDPKNTDDPIPDSNQLIFKLLPKSAHPPLNSVYQPQAVDTSTIFCIRDAQSATVYIYWSVPSFSFGDVQYKLIEDDMKEDRIIKSLPHAIPFSKIPISFKIVTQTMVDGKCYQSDPSQPIIVDNSNQKMSDVPDSLQMLSVDGKDIDIKLTLKGAPKQNTKFMIQCMDENNHRWTQRFTVGRIPHEMVLGKPDNQYKFVILLNDEQKAQNSNFVQSEATNVYSWLRIDPNNIDEMQQLKHKLGRLLTSRSERYREELVIVYKEQYGKHLLKQIKMKIKERNVLNLIRGLLMTRAQYDAMLISEWIATWDIEPVADIICCRSLAMIRELHEAYKKKYKMDVSKLLRALAQKDKKRTLMQVIRWIFDLKRTEKVDVDQNRLSSDLDFILTTKTFKNKNKEKLVLIFCTNSVEHVKVLNGEFMLKSKDSLTTFIDKKLGPKSTVGRFCKIRIEYALDTPDYYAKMIKRLGVQFKKNQKKISDIFIQRMEIDLDLIQRKWNMKKYGDGKSLKEWVVARCGNGSSSGIFLSKMLDNCSRYVDFNKQQQPKIGGSAARGTKFAALMM
eukprot:976036_1